MTTNEETAEIEMEIFRTGDYGPKGRYSEADLDQISADYRPDLLEAPLTFDHAQTGPAFGWVAQLRRDGDRLIAAIKGVPRAVKELLIHGSYKRRSVELFRQLPHTGRPYLRAVSLLGAATPEVKGLRDVCFASSQETVAMEMSASGACQQDLCARQEPVQRQQQQQLLTMFSELRKSGYCIQDDDAQALKRLLGGEMSASEECRVAEFSADLHRLERLLRTGLLQAPLQTDLPSVPSHQPGAPALSAEMGGAVGTRHSASEEFASFSERTLPQSMALHHAAVANMAAAPGLDYREALLKASRAMPRFETPGRA